jgi:hypothetical protein
MLFMMVTMMPMGMCNDGKSIGKESKQTNRLKNDSSEREKNKITVRIEFPQIQFALGKASMT